jgi:heat shock protein 5
MEEFGPWAVAEDFEEQRQMLSDVAYPITSRLYSGAGEGVDDVHDEL